MNALLYSSGAMRFVEVINEETDSQGDRVKELELSRSDSNGLVGE
jgi:hypothetical protein